MIETKKLPSRSLNPVTHSGFNLLLCFLIIGQVAKLFLIGFEFENCLECFLINWFEGILS